MENIPLVKFIKSTFVEWWPSGLFYIISHVSLSMT